MASQVICDLCGHLINNPSDYEKYKYKIKKKWWLWAESGWQYIDVHESCRRKLFQALKEFKPPHSDTSMQKN